MRAETARALYGLSIDAFIEGISSEIPHPQEFGLTEKQAVEVRRNRFSQKREGKVA